MNPRKGDAFGDDDVRSDADGRVVVDYGAVVGEAMSEVKARLTKIEEAAASIKEGLARFYAMHDALAFRVTGNENAIKDVADDVDSLKSSRAWLIGALAALGVVVSVAGAYVVQRADEMSRAIERLEHGAH